MTKWRAKSNICACAVAALMVGMWAAPTAVRADDLDSVLPYVVENHDRVRAAKSRLSAARNRAREALGAWFPTLSQTANAGHEKQHNDNGPDTSTGFNEWDISLTQLLWDFGSTNASVDKARLQVEEARYSLIEARQALILEAITAYVDVRRANATLRLANESEENIRRQTGLEEALVELGSGFSTDVLQSKRDLAGAQARKSENEGALETALNRYKAVFGRTPTNPGELVPVPFPAAYVPSSLTQALDIALEANPALKNAILAADIAREDVRIAKADNFFPTIEGTAERKFKKNVGGTIGSEQETLAKVEMTFDFNLGMTAVNTLKASEEDLSATEFTAADTRRNIEEQVRNAWQQLQTAQRTAAIRSDQASIAVAFLELARSERQLGRRSLIDVLNGETQLILAQIEALSAEADVTIAAYGILAATGQLEYDLLNASEHAPKPRYNTGAAPQPGVDIPSPPVVDLRTQTPVAADTNTAAARSAQDFKILMSALENENPVDAGSAETTRWAEISQRETPKSVPRELASLDTSDLPLAAPLPPVVRTETSRGKSDDLPVSATSDNEPAATNAEYNPEVAALPSASAAASPLEDKTPADRLSSAASSIFSFFQRAHEASVAAEAKRAEVERRKSERARARLESEVSGEERATPETESVSTPLTPTVIEDTEKQKPTGIGQLFSDLLALFTSPRDSAEGATADDPDGAAAQTTQPVAAVTDEDVPALERTQSPPTAPRTAAIVGASDRAETGPEPVSSLGDFFSAILNIFKSPTAAPDVHSTASATSTVAAPIEPSISNETHAADDVPAGNPFELTSDGAKLIAAIGNMFSRPSGERIEPATSEVLSESIADD